MYSCGRQNVGPRGPPPPAPRWAENCDTIHYDTRKLSCYESRKRSCPAGRRRVWPLLRAFEDDSSCPLCSFKSAVSACRTLLVRVNSIARPSRAEGRTSIAWQAEATLAVAFLREKVDGLRLRYCGTVRGGDKHRRHEAGRRTDCTDVPMVSSPPSCMQGARTPRSTN